MNTLVDGRVSAGEHVVAIEYVNSEGEPLSAGNYLCVMEAGREIRTVSVSIAR